MDLLFEPRKEDMNPHLLTLNNVQDVAEGKKHTQIDTHVYTSCGTMPSTEILCVNTCVYVFIATSLEGSSSLNGITYFL